MSTSRRACVRARVRGSVGAPGGRHPLPISRGRVAAAMTCRGHAKGRPCTLRRPQGWAWRPTSVHCPPPDPRGWGRRAQPQTHQPTSNCDSRMPELPSGVGPVGPLTGGLGRECRVCALSGHPGRGGLRGPWSGAGPRPSLSLPRPVWATFWDGQAGPGWAAGASRCVPLPGAPSGLHPPRRPDPPRPSPPRSCFYYKRNIAGVGLSFPPTPRWPPWSGLDASWGAWLTRPLRARPVPRHLLRSASWPRRLSGLRAGLLCGGHFLDEESKAPEVKWPVQGRPRAPGACIRGRAVAPACTNVMGPSVSPHRHCSLLK